MNRDIVLVNLLKRLQHLAKETGHHGLLAVAEEINKHVLDLLSKRS